MSGTDGLVTCGFVPVCSFGFATGAVSVFVKSGRGIDVTCVGLSVPLWPSAGEFVHVLLVPDGMPIPELAPPIVTWSCCAVPVIGFVYGGPVTFTGLPTTPPVN